MADEPISDQELDELIERAGGADALAAKAKRRSQTSTRSHFERMLLDRTKSPAEYAVNLRVNNWATLIAFFAAQPTEQHHLQRVYQDIREDIKEAIQNQDAQLLIRSLLLGAKAVS